MRPEWEGPRFLGYLANISENGAFVQCSNPRPVGTTFSLRLRLPGGPAEGLACAGEVIWARGHAGVDGPGAGMGIRFAADLEEGAREFLDYFCAHFEPLSQSLPPIAQEPD